MSQTHGQQVAEGKVVGIYFTLKNSRGEVLDTNRKGGRPLAFLCGRGQLLPALEQALRGKQKGDEVFVELSPAEGYGERNPEGIRQAPRSAFDDDALLQPGVRFSGTDESGQPVHLLVTAVDGDRITVDHNHPLAGERLRFEVTIVGVREPTADELQHGHPHGPGGHHH